MASLRAIEDGDGACSGRCAGRRRRVRSGSVGQGGHAQQRRGWIRCRWPSCGAAACRPTRRARDQPQPGREVSEGKADRSRPTSVRMSWAAPALMPSMRVRCEAVQRRARVLPPRRRMVRRTARACRGGRPPAGRARRAVVAATCAWTASSSAEVGVQMLAANSR